ncbi:BUD13 homolog isoform X2 [Sorex araneus]|uniref:BUD13 homolog isoform X2 n=1 Tax=Sorex araneus TaxID=42254 RepID=UPI002433F1D6|nr:BUD13 homolog isoform X2 [Sorex araneus]
MEICLWWLNLWTSGRKRSSRWKSSAPVPSGSFWEKEELLSERQSQQEALGSSSKDCLHDTPDPSPQRTRHDTPDPSPPRRGRHDTPDPSPPRRGRHDTPDPSPPRRGRHDTPDPSPPRRGRHDTPDPSPPQRGRHDTPDPSPPRRGRHDTPDPSPPRRGRHDTPDPSPPRRSRHDTPDSSPRRKPHHHASGVPPQRARRSTPDLSPPRRARPSPPETSLSGRTHGCSDTAQHRKAHHGSRDLDPSAPHSLTKAQSTRAPERTSSKHDSSTDLSPPRKKQAKTHYAVRKPSPGRQDSDSDLSPPRNRPRPQSSDSDLSPPRRKRRASSSDSDLSPPRRSQPRGKKAAHMYSGAKTGLVLTDIQQEEQELRKRDRDTVALEAEFQHAETVFRDKSGRKRNLKLERLEQRKKAEKDSERDELYAQWGKGLVQSRQQQQNVEDAMKEMQKPLARYIDDEDLDRMLREQEREGDPMANFIKKNKAKESKSKKARPRYSGPAPPPNRFNIWPGYRWDGVDRSNGFEQKRFARLASKKAIEEMAYKWSVEDM